MNTAALRTFAPAVRRQLMEAVTRKLDFALTAKTPDFLTTYAPQVAALRKLEKTDRAGLIERVAYTWFNRLAALRFMDARDWHPFRSRVLTPARPAETQPELLKLMRTGALPEELRRHTDPQRLNDLLDGKIPSMDAQGEVYRSLVLSACHFYHALLPDIFEKLDDETELLLPDDLLTEQSIVHGLRTEISDEDCGEVEIIGWLYQFYISEKKDQVMARKTAVPTEDIPAVTQLFTPHWIVRYLVENSLGRLWLLNRPGSKLREHMPYYIEGEPETDFLKITKPEEIRVCDPAVGSGHMLTYAFDLLTLIYEEEGYAPGDIPGMILKNNLYGLEICPRAAQLAELALVFKAREKSRRFFQPEHLVRPHIIELRDVRFAENELRDYIQALGLGDLFNQPMLKLLHQFEQAKNFGSLIQPCLDEKNIVFARRVIEAKDLGGQLFLRETHLKVLRVLEQAESLTQRYHVVVANPPYMGRKGMNANLGDWLEKSFPLGKSDLMTCFMERNGTLSVDLGFWAMINLPSWMFIGAFKKLREKIISSWTVVSLLHLGRGIFGSDFGSVAFVVQTSSKPNRSKSVFRKLFKRHVQVRSVKAIEDLFLDPEVGKYVLDQQSFSKIPGSPFAYWVDQRVFRLFEQGILEDHYELSNCIQPGSSEEFLRLWHEVAIQGLQKKWKFASKGGPYKKWYGNREYVINYGGAGKELLQHPSTTLRTPEKYFQEGIVWTRVTSGATGFRWWPSDCLVTDAGPIIYAKDDLPLLGLLNSNLTKYLLEAISPTLNLQVGSVGVLPFTLVKSIAPGVQEVMNIARCDWESIESSDGFLNSPLLSVSEDETVLAQAFQKLERVWEARLCETERLERKINTEINEALDLKNLIPAEVPKDEITLTCNPHYRYGRKSREEHHSLSRNECVRDLLSYSVGCMMGRYSLDQPGLILANAGDTVKEFLAKLNLPLDKLTFNPDEDGIIPVLDGEWFEDDIVSRTRGFLRATYGEATLRENIRFIEDSLGKDLRKYFLNDFYKDHLQTYKKRPIYWLVQSPKKGFSVLIYLHRYTRDTMNLVLNRYLRDYQVKMRNRLAHVTELQVTAATAKAKTEARKEVEKLTKILAECDEWERQTMLPLAQARIELDLDDGVKINYLKLGEALAPIAGLAAKEEE